MKMRDTQPWMEHGDCATTDPELFFPGKGEPGYLAKMICAQCPVRAACADYAIAQPSLEGIWGGLSFRDRKELRRAIGVAA